MGGRVFSVYCQSSALSLIVWFFDEAYRGYKAQYEELYAQYRAIKKRAILDRSARHKKYLIPPTPTTTITTRKSCFLKLLGRLERCYAGAF